MDRISKGDPRLDRRARREKTEEDGQIVGNIVNQLFRADPHSPR